MKKFRPYSPDFVRLFPHYANLDDSCFEERPKVRPDLVESSDNELLRIIFAPDPLTGVPRSDLAVVLSKDTSPEVSQFIRDNLLKPRADDGVSTDDPDLALQGIKSRGESLEEYAERLRELANKSD